LSSAFYVLISNFIFDLKYFFTFVNGLKPHISNLSVPVILPIQITLKPEVVQILFFFMKSIKKRVDGRR